MVPALAAAGIACSGAGATSAGYEHRLATGARHTCAIAPPGTLRCWGSNGTGQLGRSPGGTDAVDLGTGRTATAVFAGLDHTCAILDDGAVKCWGLNSFGQLGLEDTIDRGDGLGPMGDALPAVDLGAGRRAVALALGGSATCALLDDGRVKCWGDAYQGATGHGDIDTRGDRPGTMGDHLLPADLGSHGGAPLKVTQIAAVDYHSFCAILAPAAGGPLAESGLKCWGSNDYCEIAIGTREGGRGAEPETLGDHLGFVDLGTTASGARRKAVAIAGGFQFICALGDDGAVNCWGDNGGAQLGLGFSSSPRSCLPEELGNAGLVSLPGRAVAISARGLSDGGGAHVCARLAGGEVLCWGENGFGQLGTGGTAPLAQPAAPVAFGDGFTPEVLRLGNEHSCAIAKDGRARCWGSNGHGQLGPAVSGDISLTPTPVVDLGGAP